MGFRVSESETQAGVVLGGFVVDVCGYVLRRGWGCQLPEGKKESGRMVAA